MHNLGIPLSSSLLSKTVKCTLNSWGLDAMVEFIICSNTLLITSRKIIFYNDSLTLLPLIIISAAFRYSIQMSSPQMPME